MHPPLAGHSLAIGTWKLTEWAWTPQQILTWLEQCDERGIRLIDSADIYGSYQSEALLGKALRLRPGLRSNLTLISKCGIKLLSSQRPQHRVKSYDSSAEHIVRSVEQSLSDLNTDYLDGLLLHRPDPLLEPQEVAEAIEKLKQQGKVRAFGVSNFTPSQFDLLNRHTHLFTNQVQCSLLHLDPLFDGTFDQAMQLQRAPMIWSPVASGRLFVTDGEREHRVRDTLNAIADKYSVSASVIALTWLFRHPAQLIPIIGSSKIERYIEAQQAQLINLTREEWHQLWSASIGKNIP